MSTILEGEADLLFHRYAYPDWLRTHSLLVGRIALLLAEARTGAGVDPRNVGLGGYLHDVGRSTVLAGDGREHGELGALVLAAEGRSELAEFARRHPVYAVLDQATAPRTLAERMVYEADRRGGLEVLSLDERIREVASRHPRYTAEIERARPIAEAIERELFEGLPFAPDELADRVEAQWPS